MPSSLEPGPGAAQPKPNVRKTLDTTFWLIVTFKEWRRDKNPGARIFVGARCQGYPRGGSQASLGEKISVVLATAAN